MGDADDDRQMSLARRALHPSARPCGRCTATVSGSWCELRYHGEYGVEYRLFQNDQFYRGKGFATRMLAVQAAEIVRRQLEDEGWSQS